MCARRDGDRIPFEAIVPVVVPAARRTDYRREHVRRDEELLELIQDYDQWLCVEPRRRFEHPG
ncbi:MAG: hypothetical protein L0Z51_09195, partial [Candidatus Latescibacteria bacterium]|nr:hypothetical protein [Candidatus Latescibacterota bacterium]